jgi:putative membrane-bound dehydrogenase-like protein
MIHRRRLFSGMCLALIPTGASFALVSNVLVQLKQEFILTNYQVGLIAGAALWGMAISLLVMGPLLEGFGLKNGARLAFLGHVAGITLMIAAVTRVGDPSAFWMLMGGAATLAAGNGMIEVTGNPLVAALFPDEKTKRLNWFHAFFPIGIVVGGVVGFLLATYGGAFARWPWQLAVIYVPIVIYGVLVLPQQFPKTENAEAGVPVGTMFRYTLTSPLFLLMLAMMAITTSLELGPMRWIPSVLQAGGLHGILVLVWISGWMVVLRALAGHAVEKLSPPGMLLAAAILTGSGLFLLSFAHTTWTAFAAATIFAWGVAFFFPTMVGTVSERMPLTGSLGIVLTAGIGLGMSGAVGVPLMGKLADRYIAESLPPQTTDLLLRVEARFPTYVTHAHAATNLASLGYREQEVQAAIAATRAALRTHEQTGSIHNDATANALRAIVATAIPNEPLVAEANGILQPAEAAGGQRSFRYIAPGALVLILVFGLMYLNDRRRGGYRAVKLERMAALLLLGALAPLHTASAQSQRGTPPVLRPAANATARATQAPRTDRLRVLFLGDNGHHQPTARAKQLLPVLAADGVDLFYTDDLDDLNTSELRKYDALMLYNNYLTVAPKQLAALLSYVESGHGLVVLHCASASFQNSEEFIRLVGAAFKSHGTGTFSAVRVAVDHPAIRGVPAFESWDETYIHTKHNPVDRTVLEVRRENGHDEPWTWVRTYGKGRVFYTAWGHDQRTWSQPGFQKLVEHGLRWTIGDWALTYVAKGPVTRMMDLEVPLPTYKQTLPDGRPAPWNTPDSAVKKAQMALSTRESLQLMTLRPGFSVKPFAFEPLIGNIIDFTWDARGRVWAIETNDYPNVVLPDSVPGHDRVLIIEDANGDGVADRTTVFADGLNLATTLALVKGGVIVGQAPHMLLLKDTNGDGKADSRTILSTGWPRNDTHGSISNLRYGFDNQIWGSVGYNGFRGTVGTRTYGRGQFGSGYFRFPRDGSDLDYLARTSNNTWGVGLTEDGYTFGSTANNNPSVFVHIPLRYYRAVGMREPTLPDISDRRDIFPVRDILQVDQFGRYTAGSGHEIYSARAFPPEYWNRVAFVAEPTGHVIGMFEIQDNGSGFREKNRWSLMASRDAWAAPVQIKVGPDGALWVSDFYTLVAQHNPTPDSLMKPTEKYPEGCCRTGRGAAYETPNRDKLHGRMYRIVYDSARPTAPMRLDNATPQQLVRALTNDNMFWRMTAQRLLVERGRTDVVPALIALVNTQTVDAQALNPGALHALWTLHGLGALDSIPAALAAARAALTHPAGSVRRAALQVLPRDDRLVADVLNAGILPDRASPWPVEYTVGSNMLQDANGHVRLEALLALADVPPSAHVASLAMDALFVPENARDPWIPDAVAIVGAHQQSSFLGDLLQRRAPADSVALTGVARAVQLLAYSRAVALDANLVALAATAQQLSPGVARSLLFGTFSGWPDERPPQVTAEQRAALVATARAMVAAEAAMPQRGGGRGNAAAGPPNTPQNYAQLFAQLAVKWGIPELGRQ